jgi:hypothetical protein
VEAELQANRILVKPLVPHASDQIQQLNLGIYGLCKRYYVRPVSVQVKAVQTAQAMTMCNAWFEAAVPHIIVRAFRRAGMAPEVTAAGRVWQHRSATGQLLHSLRREWDLRNFLTGSTTRNTQLNSHWQ